MGADTFTSALIFMVKIWLTTVNLKDIICNIRLTIVDQKKNGANGYG